MGKLKNWHLRPSVTKFMGTMEDLTEWERVIEYPFVKQIWKKVDVLLNNTKLQESSVPSPSVLNDEKNSNILSDKSMKNRIVLSSDIPDSSNSRTAKSILQEDIGVNYEKFCEEYGIQLIQPKNLLTPLYMFQAEAVRWMLYVERTTGKGGLLADEMGLGKTLTMIGFILKNKEINGDTPDRKQTLIVCPASLRDQWRDEFHDHVEQPSLTVCVYADDNRPSTLRELKNFDVVITSLELLNQQKDSDFLFKIKWNRIVIDEAHRVRTKTKQYHKCVKALKSEYRWCITASPYQIEDGNVSALLNFIGYEGANSSYYKPILSKCMLYRSLHSLQEMGLMEDLPKLNVLKVEHKLEGRHRQIYEAIFLDVQYLWKKGKSFQFEKDFVLPESALADALCSYEKRYPIKEDTTAEKSVRLPLWEKLQQLSVHPGLIYTEENKRKLGQESVTAINWFVKELVVKCPESIKNVIGDIDYKTWKIEKTLDLVQEILEKEEKVVIASQWVGHLYIVENFLRKMDIKCYKFMVGLVSLSERRALKAQLNSRGDPQILLVTMDCCGEGLNLTGANNMIILDYNYNPQKIKQLIKRTHRIGQTREVFVHVLITLNTIEETAMKSMEEREKAAEAVLNSGNKESLSQLKKMSRSSAL